MGLKTETRTIDEFEVTTTQLPALRGLKLMSRLGRVLAPALGGLDGLSLESDVAALAPLLGSLFVQLEEDDAAELALAILCNTSIVIDGKRIELNTPDRVNLAFAGRLGTLLSCVRFSLEVNYGDFFAPVLAAVASSGGREEKSSTSTATSEKAG